MAKTLADFGFFNKKIAADEAQSSTEPDKDVSVSEPKKIVRTKRFQSSWHKEFSWLEHKDGLLICTVCRAFERTKSTKSTFGAGSANYQRSALVRHQSSYEHMAAIGSSKQKLYFEAAVKVVKEKHDTILEAQLKTALYMATENIANRKFQSLIDLQISNANAFTLKDVSSSTDSQNVKISRPPGIYTNHQAASVMQKALAETVKEMAIMQIQKSPFVGIMLDESLDIATTKKLVMFCKIINNETIRLEFCTNVEIADGKAETIYNCILDWLQSVGIGVEKISGFGSDGASVMMGRHTGVGVRLKSDNPRIIHIWCAAHRVALVSYWAAKTIPYLQNVQTTLIQIYSFYEYSAPRYNKIKELKTLMGGKIKKFKRPTQVRWLSLQDAVEAVYESWPSLVLGLEHETAAAPLSEGGNKAKGLLKKIKSFKFIATICLLRDVLNILCTLSKIFQADIIHIDKVVKMIDSTKATIASFQEIENDTQSVTHLIEWIEETEEYHGIPIEASLRDRLIVANIRRKFVRNIISEFENRFPDDDMKILKEMNMLLNPTCLPLTEQGLREFGIDVLKRVLFDTLESLNRNRATESYLQFKYLLNISRQKSLEEFCLDVIAHYKEVYPDFAILAQILMTVPLTSVPCERGFSVQNKHVDKFTNRRNPANVENRMRLQFESKQSDFDITRIVHTCAQKM